MNNYSEWIRLYKGNSRYKNNALMLLIILYVGRDRLINIVYSEILNRTIVYTEDNKVYKTELIATVFKKVSEILHINQRENRTEHSIT